MVMIDYDNDDDDDNDGDAFFASWPVLVEPSPLAQASGLVGVVAKKKNKHEVYACLFPGRELHAGFVV